MELSYRAQSIRANHVTATDSPAIMGLSRYRNIMDVYTEKLHPGVHLEPDANKKEESLAIQLGNALESGLIDLVAKRIETTGVKRNCLRVSRNAKTRFMSCTFDALCNDRPEAVEIKTSALAGPVSPSWLDQWGDEFTDEVPTEYLIQCQHQIYVGNLRRVWLGALIGGVGFRLYEIERNEELIREIIIRAAEFWRHVQEEIPPADIQVSDIETLKRIPRKPGSVVFFPESAYKEVLLWDLSKKIRNRINDAVDERWLSILSQMGDSEIAVLPDGRQLKYAMQTRSGFDEKRFKVDYPDLYHEYSKTTEYRVARLPKSKQEDNSNGTIEAILTQIAATDGVTGQTPAAIESVGVAQFDDTTGGTPGGGAGTDAEHSEVPVLQERPSGTGD